MLQLSQPLPCNSSTGERLSQCEPVASMASFASVKAAEEVLASFPPRIVQIMGQCQSEHLSFLNSFWPRCILKLSWMKSGQSVVEILVRLS